jgi:hypothetical protein
MDLKQKYTEEIKFEISDWFFEDLMLLSEEAKDEVIYDIEKVIDSLPNTGDYSVPVFGVVYCEELFYILEYRKKDEELPIIFSIEFISSDEYLDAINENNTIKYYGKQK